MDEQRPQLPGWAHEMHDRLRVVEQRGLVHSAAIDELMGLKQPPKRGLSSIPPFIREHRKVGVAVLVGAALASFALELARGLGWVP